jgi:hypothetical protein
MRRGVGLEDRLVGCGERRAGELDEAGEVSRGQHLGQLRHGLLQRVASGDRQTVQLGDVLGHASKPVQRWCLAWRERCDHRGGGHPVRQQGSAGERGGAASRLAPHGQATHVELVRDCRDVGGGGGDGAARLRGGAAVAGTVVGHKPDAGVGGRGRQGVVHEP